MVGWRWCLFFGFIMSSFCAQADFLTIRRAVTEGVPVFFVPTTHAPVVDIALIFRSGSAYDPVGKEGLARLVAASLSWGAKNNNRLHIKKQLMAVGARYEWSVDPDTATFHLRVLSDERTLFSALRTFVSFMTQPTFPVEGIEQEKDRMRMQWVERKSDFSQVGALLLRQEAYGAHPYHSFETDDSLVQLTRKDVLSFYRKHFTKRSLKIVLVGHVSEEYRSRIVSELLETWPTGERLRRLPVLHPKEGLQKHISFPSQQTYLAFATVVPSCCASDYFPLLIVNHVFGGDHRSSRLVLNLEKKESLALFVQSQLLPHRQGGLFIISMQTRYDQEQKAAMVVHKELAKLISDCLTEDEIEKAKEYLIKAFPLPIDSHAGYLTAVSFIARYDLSTHWLGSYAQRIRAVTRRKICQAIQRNIRLPFLSSISVGPDKAMA